MISFTTLSGTDKEISVVCGSLRKQGFYNIFDLLF